MIAHLRGRLFSKQPGQPSSKPVAWATTYHQRADVHCAAEGSGEVALYVYTHVREDTLALYGFSIATRNGV